MTDMKTLITAHLDAAFQASSHSHVVPIVLLQVPGCGVVTETTAYAKDRSMPFIEMRCAMMDFRDFAPLPKFVPGFPVVAVKHSLRAIHDVITKNEPSMVILSDAVSNGIQVAARALEQIADEATARVVVPIVVLHDQREDAMRAIALGLGMLPDEVTVRVVASEEHGVRSYVAYARANGVDEAILSLIEENDGFLGSTPYGWTRYSAMRDSDEFALLDLHTKKAIALATIGEEAYEAFKASLGKRL